MPHEDVSVYLVRHLVHIGRKFVPSGQKSVIMGAWRTGTQANQVPPDAAPMADATPQSLPLPKAHSVQSDGGSRVPRRVDRRGLQVQGSTRQCATPLSQPMGGTPSQPQAHPSRSASKTRDRRPCLRRTERHPTRGMPRLTSRPAKSPRSLTHSMDNDRRGGY